MFGPKLLFGVLRNMVSNCPTSLMCSQGWITNYPRIQATTLDLSILGSMVLFNSLRW